MQENLGVRSRSGCSVNTGPGRRSISETLLDCSDSTHLCLLYGVSDNKVAYTSVIEQTIIAVAQKWTDPEYPPRTLAESITLEAPNRFTEESLAFAINYAMDLLSSQLKGVYEEDKGEEAVVVGVLLNGETPLQGLLEIIEHICRGHKAVAVVPEASPALLPAFFSEVNESLGKDVVRFASEPEVIRYAEILTGYGAEEDAERWKELALQEGFEESALFFSFGQYVVGIIDGSENHADLSGFAEDILLHEGGASANIRLLFAPKNQSPDPLLNVLAGFRELFPPHESTDGSLAMPAAFLESAGQSFAVGPGFLISKGDPESQSGAHLRWSEYENLEDVVSWVSENASRIRAISAAPELAEKLVQAGLSQEIEVIHPGDAHRPGFGAGLSRIMVHRRV